MTFPSKLAFHADPPESANPQSNLSQTSETEDAEQSVISKNNFEKNRNFSTIFSIYYLLRVVTELITSYPSVGYILLTKEKSFVEQVLFKLLVSKRGIQAAEMKYATFKENLEGPNLNKKPELDEKSEAVVNAAQNLAAAADNVAQEASHTNEPEATRLANETSQVCQNIQQDLKDIQNFVFKHQNSANAEILKLYRTKAWSRPVLLLLAALSKSPIPKVQSILAKDMCNFIRKIKTYPEGVDKHTNLRAILGVIKSIFHLTLMPHGNHNLLARNKDHLCVNYNQINLHQVQTSFPALLLKNNILQELVRLPLVLKLDSPCFQNTIYMNLMAINVLSKLAKHLEIKKTQNEAEKRILTYLKGGKKTKDKNSGSKNSEKSKSKASLKIKQSTDSVSKVEETMTDTVDSDVDSNGTKDNLGSQNYLNDEMVVDPELEINGFAVPGHIENSIMDQLADMGENMSDSQGDHQSGSSESHDRDERDEDGDLMSDDGQTENPDDDEEDDEDGQDEEDEDDDDDDDDDDPDNNPDDENLADFIDMMDDRHNNRNNNYTTGWTDDEEEEEDEEDMEEYGDYSDEYDEESHGYENGWRDPHDLGDTFGDEHDILGYNDHRLHVYGNSNGHRHELGRGHFGRIHRLAHSDAYARRGMNSSRLPYSSMGGGGNFLRPIRFGGDYESFEATFYPHGMGQEPTDAEMDDYEMFESLGQEFPQILEAISSGRSGAMNMTNLLDLVDHFGTDSVSMRFLASGDIQIETQAARTNNRTSVSREISEQLVGSLNYNYNEHILRGCLGFLDKKISILCNLYCFWAVLSWF